MAPQKRKDGFKGKQPAKRKLSRLSLASSSSEKELVAIDARIQALEASSGILSPVSFLANRPRRHTKASKYAQYCAVVTDFKNRISFLKSQRDASSGPCPNNAQGSNLNLATIEPVSSANNARTIASSSIQPSDSHSLCDTKPVLSRYVNHQGVNVPSPLQSLPSCSYFSTAAQQLVFNAPQGPSRGFSGQAMLSQGLEGVSPFPSCPAFTKPRASSGTSQPPYPQRIFPKQDLSSSQFNPGTIHSMTPAPIPYNAVLLEDQDIDFGYHLLPATIHRILRGEYMDIFSLLNRESEDVWDEEEVRWKRPARCWENWLPAFLIYASVVIRSQSKYALSLLKYLDNIYRAYVDFPGDAWLLYDEAFRRSMAFQSWLHWDKLNTTLWLRFMAVARPGVGNRFDSGHQVSGSVESNSPCFSWGQQFQSRRACWEFNSEGSCSQQECRFQHICSVCSGSHPLVSCFRRMKNKGPRKGKGKRRKPRRSPLGSSGVFQPN